MNSTLGSVVPLAMFGLEQTKVAGAVRRHEGPSPSYAPEESFVAIFALDEKLPTSATLLVTSSRIVVDGAWYCWCYPC